jgi:predicted deacylase
MRLPQYGMGMADAEVVEWLKAVGEAVSEGEPVVVVDAAKTTVEVNAPASGTLVEQKYDVRRCGRGRRRAGADRDVARELVGTDQHHLRKIVEYVPQVSSLDAAATT